MSENINEIFDLYNSDPNSLYDKTEDVVKDPTYITNIAEILSSQNKLTEMHLFLILLSKSIKKNINCVENIELIYSNLKKVLIFPEINLNLVTNILHDLIRKDGRIAYDYHEFLLKLLYQNVDSYFIVYFVFLMEFPKYITEDDVYLVVDLIEKNTENSHLNILLSELIVRFTLHFKDFELFRKHCAFVLNSYHKSLISENSYEDFNTLISELITHYPDSKSIFTQQIFISLLKSNDVPLGKKYCLLEFFDSLSEILFNDENCITDIILYIAFDMFTKEDDIHGESILTPFFSKISENAIENLNQYVLSIEDVSFQVVRSKLIVFNYILDSITVDPKLFMRLMEYSTLEDEELRLSFYILFLHISAYDPSTFDSYYIKGLFDSMLTFIDQSLRNERCDIEYKVVFLFLKFFEAVNYYQFFEEPLLIMLLKLLSDFSCNEKKTLSCLSILSTSINISLFSSQIQNICVFILEHLSGLNEMQGQLSNVVFDLCDVIYKKLDNDDLKYKIIEFVLPHYSCGVHNIDFLDLLISAFDVLQKNENMMKLVYNIIATTFSNEMESMDDKYITYKFRLYIKIKQYFDGKKSMVNSVVPKLTDTIEKNVVFNIEDVLFEIDSSLQIVDRQHIMDFLNTAYKNIISTKNEEILEHLINAVSYVICAIWNNEHLSPFLIECNNALVEYILTYLENGCNDTILESLNSYIQRAIEYKTVDLLINKIVQFYLNCFLNTSSNSIYSQWIYHILATSLTEYNVMHGMENNYFTVFNTALDVIKSHEVDISSDLLFYVIIFLTIFKEELESSVIHDIFTALIQKLEIIGSSPGLNSTKEWILNTISNMYLDNLLIFIDHLNLFDMINKYFPVYDDDDVYVSCYDYILCTYEKVDESQTNPDVYFKFCRRCFEIIHEFLVKVDSSDISKELENRLRSFLVILYQKNSNVCENIFSSELECKNFLLLE